MPSSWRHNDWPHEHVQGELVGLEGFEPTTFALSKQRSKPAELKSLLKSKGSKLRFLRKDSRIKMKNIPSASHWIDLLHLTPHPEGGFYKETYRAKEQIPASGLPDRFSAPRSFSTAIYFLLRSQDRSRFHRIKSDEIWHFHSGTVLEIFVLIDGKLSVMRLGDDILRGESLQVVVPANCWFGAKVAQPGSYTLAGCTVAPGFDFNDFEMADREYLLREFPDQHEIIKLLT